MIFINLFLTGRDLIDVYSFLFCFVFVLILYSSIFLHWRCSFFIEIYENPLASSKTVKRWVDLLCKRYFSTFFQKILTHHTYSTIFNQIKLLLLCVDFIKIGVAVHELSKRLIRTCHPL